MSTQKELGTNAFKAKNFEEAAEHFSKAIEEDPNNAWGWHGRGDALQLLGDYKGSLEAYDKAIFLQPTTALHYGGKSNALRGLDQHDKSAIEKERALALDASLGWLFTD